MTKFREATTAEILAAKARDIASKRKVSYRHFTRECYRADAANGVSHRRYSRSAIRVVDGEPHVVYHGKLEPITGSVATLDNGKEIVWDLRIKSEYLK